MHCISVCCPCLPTNWPCAFWVSQTLSHSLGILAVHCSVFCTAVKDAYAHIQRMLHVRTCNGKDEGNASGRAWELADAVMTADGCWLTRDHFIQNFTFIVKNYLKNTIDWYGHLSMRGNDSVVKEPLYPGTAKSGEGHLAGKWTGRTVTPHQQRPSQKCTYKCPSCIVQGMFGRHTHRLTNLKGMKAFTMTYKDNHSVKLLYVTSVTCCCARSSTGLDTDVLLMMSFTMRA